MTGQDPRGYVDRVGKCVCGWLIEHYSTEPENVWHHAGDGPTDVAPHPASKREDSPNAD
jgi:hypothetical protein